MASGLRKISRGPLNPSIARYDASKAVSAANAADEPLLSES